MIEKKVTLNEFISDHPNPSFKDNKINDYVVYFKYFHNTLIYQSILNKNISINDVDEALLNYDFVFDNHITFYQFSDYLFLYDYDSKKVLSNLLDHNGSVYNLITSFSKDELDYLKYCIQYLKDNGKKKFNKLVFDNHLKWDAIELKLWPYDKSKLTTK